MADNIKVGQFIKEERKNIGLSQEELANKLFVTRQAVSKWEQGKSLPGYDLIQKICEIFNITTNEYFLGERIKKENKKEINNIPIKILKEEKKKQRKIFFISFAIIILLILLFFFFYFFNTYKKVEVYSIYGQDENFKINNSNAFISNDRSYINLGNIETEKEVVKLNLYYLKEDSKREIFTSSCRRKDNCSSSSFGGSIMQVRGGDTEYFTYEDIPLVIENLYVDISYYDNKDDKEEKIATIKLDFTKLYTNNNLFFFYDKEEKGEPIIFENDGFNDKLQEKVISEGFKYEIEEDTENEVYVKKYKNNIIVKFYLSPNYIMVVDEKKEEWFIYDYEVKQYYFDKYNGNKVISSSNLFNDELTCYEGDCSNHLDYYNYYMDKYVNPLIDF